MTVEYKKPLLKQYATELTGLVAIIVMSTILSLAVRGSKSNEPTWNGPVILKFQNTDARIKVGDDVKLAGIKIGIVDKTYLESKTYFAVIELKIYSFIEWLPNDSIASIRSDSLIGKSFISIIPGHGTIENHSACVPVSCQLRTEEPVPNIETIIKRKLDK